MKLRIRGNSVRLRLTQNEVEKIKEFGLVEERTEFPDGSVFTYSLNTSEMSEQPFAEFSNGNLQIFISNEDAQNWVTSDETGVYGKDEKLQISVEKDFKCLTPRAEEEDADTFPHPKSDATC